MDTSPYDHPEIHAAPDTTVRIESIIGMFPRVSSAPTWTPKKFQDMFAYYLSGGEARFYIFFPNDNTWRYRVINNT